MIQHLGIGCFFFHLFENGENDSKRHSFDKYYKPLVEIKEFNVLIGNKLFFDQHFTNKQETYEKFVKMARNNNYATGNLLDYVYHQSNYTLIGIDLSRQMKHQKILNLLNETSASKFVTRKWNVAKGQWNRNHDSGNDVIYNTKVLNSSLWDYNDAYI